MAKSLIIFAYIIGLSSSSSSFHVNVGRKETVSHLKEAILKKKPNALKGIDADQLILYQVNISYENNFKNAVSQAYQSVKASPLGALCMLHHLFPTNPPEETVSILVEAPNDKSTEENKRKRGEEGDFGLGIIPPGVKRLKCEVNKGSPSDLAYPFEFSQMAGPGHLIACNRPFEPHTIPLVLLHEAFGLFQDRCEAPPSEEAFCCLSELTLVACKWYESELLRKSEIRFVLQEHLGLDLLEQKVTDTEFKSDENFPAVVMPAAIRECKNEGGHALNQAILYYANFLRNALDNPRPRYHNCNTRFPSILIIDMGSYFGFYGAAWDGEQVRVEPLTPIFDLGTPWKNTKARCAIASSFDALMVAVRNIQYHYKVVEAEAKMNPVQPEEYDHRVNTARGYPYMTSYIDDGREIAFTYNARLDETKLVFSAIFNHPNPGECIVKFTQRYSEAAHNYLASRHSAPKLRQCVRVSGEWIAVIMDKSKYQVVSDLRLSNAEQEKIRRKVKSEIQMLHGEGFVHGDIRDTNLLVAHESLGLHEVAVHIIDFDWAGRIGEATYPIGVNTKSVRRPDGVEPGGLITEQHDEDMTTHLFGSQTQSAYYNFGSQT